MQQTCGKWSETLNNFLELAKSANDSFNYERALSYLATLEELWTSKALPALSSEIQNLLYSEKARALAKLGRYGESVEEYRKLLQCNQDKASLPRRAEIFLEIGQLLAKQGEPDSALGHVHRALAVYRRLNDAHGICRSLRNLGVIYIELGEFEDAEVAYNEAIEMTSADKQSILFADLNNNLGAIKNMKGDWEGALHCYNISREVYERENEVRKTAYTINNIGITLLEQDQCEQALKNFISALRVSESIKDAPLSLILSINLTDLYIKRNEIDEAKRYCHNATQYLNLGKLKNSQLAETLKLAGRIALLEKNFDAALSRYNEALEICRDIGLQYVEAEILYEKGHLFLQTERQMEALQLLESSLKIFSQIEATGKAGKAEKLIKSIEELYLRIFESMAFKVDQKDHYTKGHSDRVAKLSLALARELYLPDAEIKAIVAGSLLHDIGKIDVPDAVLKKKGRLTNEEYEIIKNHPDAGIQRLSGIKFPWEIVPLIRYHHERYDGKGYPAGLAGELIPLGARIICVADVFDALTSERPYREAFSSQRALEVMRNEMGMAFDPLVLETLVTVVNQGRIDYIINRSTRPDELYRIWGECRMKLPQDSEIPANTPSPVAA